MKIIFGCFLGLMMVVIVASFVNECYKCNGYYCKDITKAIKFNCFNYGGPKDRVYVCIKVYHAKSESKDENTLRDCVDYNNGSCLNYDLKNENDSCSVCYTNLCNYD